MDQDSSSPPALHELRILVLHNRDFTPAETDGDGEAARADVLNAAQDVARALAARGHFVEIQGTDASDVGDLLGRLSKDRPDLVFNLCESLAGDARNEVVVPALLDMLRIPYTGSDALGLGLSLHKDRAKELLFSAAVPTPAWVTLPEVGDPTADLRLLTAARLTYPLIIKPAREDASVGISAASVVTDDAEFCAQVALLRRQHQQPLLCEQYVAGREIYVSLLGNGLQTALPLTEIDFSAMPGSRPRIVCYEAKWHPGSAADLGTRPGPAGPLAEATRTQICAAARAAAAAVGLRDYGRCDLRLAEDGTPYVIDVNPNCDLSAGAGFSLAARQGGLAYDALIEQIAAAALTRSDHVRRRAQRLVRIRPGLSQDQAPLHALVAKDGLFSPDEVSCARELIDSALSDATRGGDYRVLIATRGEALLGYICYGPTPMTQGTYDLYWLATDPSHRGQGVGAALCQAMENELRGHAGRLVRVETSTSDGYGAAHRFYERNGYPERCRLRDFYKPGDDLIILMKAL